LQRGRYLVIKHLELASTLRQRPIHKHALAAELARLELALVPKREKAHVKVSVKCG